MKSMLADCWRRTALGFICLLGCLFVGCSGGATAVVGEPSRGTAESASQRAGTANPETVELKFDQAVEVGDLELIWRDLEDSRCPVGVNCIWAGQIVVTLEVRRDTESALEVKLLRRIGEEPEVETVHGFEMRLLGVEPAPTQGTELRRSDYAAWIAVATPQGTDP